MSRDARLAVQNNFHILNISQSDWWELKEWLTSDWEGIIVQNYVYKLVLSNTNFFPEKFFYKWWLQFQPSQ